MWRRTFIIRGQRYKLTRSGRRKVVKGKWAEVNAEDIRSTRPDIPILSYLLDIPRPLGYQTIISTNKYRELEHHAAQLAGLCYVASCPSSRLL